MSASLKVVEKTDKMEFEHEVTYYLKLDYKVQNTTYENGKYIAIMVREGR